MTREEAIERIKSYKRYLMGGNPIWSVEEVAKAFDMAIEALQTDVVRCKDCKYAYFKDFDKFCHRMVGAVKPNNFCSYGERKGGDANE